MELTNIQMIESYENTIDVTDNGLIKSCIYLQIKAAVS